MTNRDVAVVRKANARKASRTKAGKQGTARWWFAGAILLLGTAALVVPIILWGIGLLDSGGIPDSKDGLGAVSAYVTMALVTLGALASYFRFFYGRTLVERAKLTLEVDVVSDGDANIHAARLVVENVGTRRLRFHWIRLKTFGNFTLASVGEVAEPVGEPPFDEGELIDLDSLYDCDGKHFIDSGESMDFLFPVRVPKTIPVVIHQARFVSSLDWKTELLVKNELKKRGRSSGDTVLDSPSA